jgi:hypothetical protein
MTNKKLELKSSEPQRPTRAKALYNRIGQFLKEEGARQEKSPKRKLLFENIESAVLGYVGAFAAGFFIKSPYDIQRHDNNLYNLVASGISATAVMITLDTGRYAFMDRSFKKVTRDNPGMFLGCLAGYFTSHLIKIK